MRREPYGLGSFVHVIKRGARGLPFLKDTVDRDRFLLLLAHFNDVPSRPLWLRDIHLHENLSPFERVPTWGEKEPLTRIHAFCAHANHIHLLLEEIVEGGVSAFMKKFGNGIAGYLNERYGEFGSPFQGAYRSKTIDDDVYLRYVYAYIHVKNTFEQFPKGYQAAEKDFDAAYAWATQFPYSSLYDHVGAGRSNLLNGNGRGIVDTALFESLWTPYEFKIFAQDVIEGRTHVTSIDPKAFSGAFA